MENAVLQFPFSNSFESYLQNVCRNTFQSILQKEQLSRTQLACWGWMSYENFNECHISAIYLQNIFAMWALVSVVREANIERDIQAEFQKVKQSFALDYPKYAIRDA